MASVDDVANTVDPILKSVDTTVVSTVTGQLAAPGFFVELANAVLVLVIIISVHGWCMAQISRFFGRRFAQFNAHTPQWKVSLLMGITIALLALAHLFETFIWAAPIWFFGMIPNLRDAYFFVLEAYTTLGEGNISLPESWRLLGPMIAITGLFTFSWTGSVLVYVMTEIGRRHAHTKPPQPHAEAAPPVPDPAAPARAKPTDA